MGRRSEAPWQVALLAVGLSLILSSIVVASPPARIPASAEAAGTSTPLAAATSFSFGASGDFGSVLPNVTSVALAQRAKSAGLNFLLGLGDLGYTTSEQQWCDMLKSQFNDLEVLAGNHDTGENGPGDIGLTAKYCPWTLGVPVVAAPQSPGYGYSYYFDYPAGAPIARFIMVAPGVIRGSTYANWNFEYWRNGSYAGGTLANYDTNFSLSHPVYYNWAKAAVLDARSKGIPWVIAGMHKMCITVGEKVACNVLSGVGQDFFDMLVSLKVDLILQAHEHNYQRSKALALGPGCPTVASGGNYNSACVAADGASGTYPAGAGSVVVIQGIGGKTMDLITISGADKEIGYFDSAMSSNANTEGAKYWGQGYVGYTVTNDSITAFTDFCPPGYTDATGACPAVVGQTFHDSFVIRRGSPPPPSGPTARFTHSPTWAKVGAPVTFDASGSSDPNPGATLQYRWDWTNDGTWDTAWSSTATATHAYAAAGTYTSRLQVLDTLGLMGNATQSVPVDGQPPTTNASPTGTAGSNGWYRSAVTVALSATDDLSGVASTWYRADLGSWKRYTSSFSVSGDGSHSVGYNSTDNAGNVEATKTLSFRIDTAAPSSSASLAGTLVNGSYVGAVNVTLTASDVTSGVASTTYRVDGGAWTPYASTFTVSSAGAHTVQFASTDNAGNVESTRSVVFTIATSADVPVTTLELAGTLGLHGWYVTNVTVTLSASDPGGSAVSINYSLDGGPWVAYATPFLVHEGSHVLRFNATNAKGGAEATQQVTIGVDTLAPVTSASLAGTMRNGAYLDSVNVTLTAADSTSGVASTTFRLDGGSWQADVAPFQIRNAGTHGLEYASSDQAGLAEATKTLSVTIESSGPAGSSPPVTTATLSGTPGGDGWFISVVSVALNASSPSGLAVTIWYRIDAAAWERYASPFTLADGAHLVEFNATDAGGAAEATQNLTVRVDTSAPATTISVTGTRGRDSWFVSPVVVGLSSADAESGVAFVRLRLDRGAWVPYDGPFLLGDGRHVLEYYATDFAGLAEAKHTTSVKVDTTPPKITATTPAGHVTTATVLLAWDAVDDEGPNLTFAVAVDGGAERPMGNGTATSLTFSDGSHAVTLEAVDEAGNWATLDLAFQVDTNPFSLTGPYSGVPTFLLIELVAGLLVLLLLARRRRKKAARNRLARARARERAERMSRLPISPASNRGRAATWAGRTAPGLRDR